MKKVIKSVPIHCYINEDMWLDDVEVEEISKEEIDRLLNEKEKN